MDYEHYILQEEAKSTEFSDDRSYLLHQNWRKRGLPTYKGEYFVKLFSPAQLSIIIKYIFILHSKLHTVYFEVHFIFFSLQWVHQSLMFTKTGCHAHKFHQHPDWVKEITKNTSIHFCTYFTPTFTTNFFVANPRYITGRVYKKTKHMDFSFGGWGGGLGVGCRLPVAIFFNFAFFKHCQRHNRQTQGFSALTKVTPISS